MGDITVISVCAIWSIICYSAGYLVGKAKYKKKEEQPTTNNPTFVKESEEVENQE